MKLRELLDKDFCIYKITNLVSGENNHNFGRPLSKDTKEKLSVALSGDKNPFFGKQHSEEFIEFLKNRKISVERKQNLSQINSGEKHPQAKFTEQDIILMREMFSTGEYSQTELSRIFDTKPNVISQIVNRVRWRHI